MMTLVTRGFSTCVHNSFRGLEDGAYFPSRCLSSFQISSNRNDKFYSTYLEQREKMCPQFHGKPLRKFKPATHVLFDLNGTILDTEDIEFCAARRYLEKFKKKYTWELHGRVMGMFPLDGAKVVIKALELPFNPDVYVHGVWQYLLLMLGEAQELPGVNYLVCHLRRCKIPTGLVSSTNQRKFNMSTANHKKLFRQLCPIVLGGAESSLAKGKPSPEIYKLAYRRLSPQADKPERVLVFEDSPNGVKAAKAAGMQVIMVPHRELPEEQVKTAGADLVLSTVWDFKPESFDLPRLPKK